MNHAVRSRARTTLLIRTKTKFSDVIRINIFFLVTSGLLTSAVMNKNEVITYTVYLNLVARYITLVPAKTIRYLPIFVFSLSLSFFLDECDLSRTRSLDGSKIILFALLGNR